jgi:cytochrome P450
MRFFQDALAAGTDTTMLTSEWAMAEVLRNPAVAERARAELDRVVGSERTVREADIPELKYVQAIAKETMRLHPPVPMLVPHLNKIPAKVFGYDIPAETAVFVNAWGIARDPAVWERALEFAPERFLEGGLHAGTEFVVFFLCVLRHRLNLFWHRF